MDETTCPKASLCANASRKCHICVNFSCFKEGASRGKGTFTEKKVLKRINDKNAHLRRGSGAPAHAKGDILDSTTLHEVKSGYSRVNTKGSKSFTIQREWLLKAEREALVEGKTSQLEFHFDGSPDDEIWVIVRLDTLQDILENNTA